jgi:hypothetical protein
MRIYVQLQTLQTAEILARSIGPEGIAERRLDLARDDPEFQAFMAEYILAGRK